MASRFLHAVILASASLAVHAQGTSKMGFQLRAYLASADPGSSVDLFLQGDAQELSRLVLTEGGRVKEAMAGWVNASVPVARVPELSADRAVRGITFSLDKGHALNDSMRVRAHVNEAHAGLPPLPQGYDGEGVLIGIIDTGLDFTHPDFQDSLGRTRVLRYWDQNFPYDPWLTPAQYGYGQAWDSTAINAGQCPAVDPLNEYGHGTTVAGAAAGNGLATGHYAGVAPKADLIVVANDMDHPNWSSSVVDAVSYIIGQADLLGRPVAINISLGDYYGSHDGMDPAALMIDQMLTDAPGRVVACAAGNSGGLPPYHLHTEVTADTSFTWFTYNPNSVLNIGAVYFDLWADTADFSNVQYSIGADRRIGGYAFRGRIPFRTIQGTLGQIVLDTLWSVDGNKLGRVFTQAEVRDGQYHMEVYIPQPDSAAQLYYRFITTGSGRFDAWSSDVFGTSKIIADIPDPSSFPPISHYVPPDTLMSIVDSWACSPHVITVGNYNNEQVYLDAIGDTVNLGGTEGAIAPASSRGPTRTGLLKPDLAAPGDIILSPGPLDFMQFLLANQPSKLAPDSLHMRNGGTSMASPVVAGTAALLLQKCPRATADMVRDAINNSAFADAFTGTVPNNRFGHGKVNAFAALVYTNVQVPITGDSTVCAGDSVMLGGPDLMWSYLWNNGSDQRDIWTMGNDTLQLTVVTPAGCIGTSDTVIVTPTPLPVPTITTNGINLESSAASGYQWYLGSLPIDGAIGQAFQAEANGYYFVQVTDSLGCAGNSDSVFVSTVDVDDLSNAENDLRLWPVPAGRQVNISGLNATEGAVNYTVADASGRVVLRGSISSGSPKIGTEGLAAGPYMLRMDGRAGVRKLRFIKR